MSRGDATLVDIVQAAELVQEFSAGMDWTQFQQDHKTQSAVIHQFVIIIGGAVKRLSSAFRSARPSVPWSKTAAMRNVLIHLYDSVDLGEVWRAATSDVPELLAQLEPLLPPGP